MSSVHVDAAEEWWELRMHGQGVHRLVRRHLSKTLIRVVTFTSPLQKRANAMCENGSADAHYTGAQEHLRDFST